MKFFELIPHDTKIDFIGKSKYFIVISVTLVLVSLGLIVFRGFNWNVEFAGGIEMRVELKNRTAPVSIDEIRRVMNNLPADIAVRGVQVNTFDLQDRNVFSIRAKGPDASDGSPVDGGFDLNILAKRIEQHLQQLFGEGNVALISMDMIGPRVGATLRANALYAILFSLVGILIYIGFRFNFRFAPGGIVALAHDVIITAGFFAITGREMSLSVLAALLTIAGYSINDTIVIFDRIREQSQHRKKTLSIGEYVNKAINETLSRTILTSLTTMMAIVPLLIFGGEILFDFALAMLIGCTAGVYSTIFVASPIYVGLERLYARRPSPHAVHYGSTAQAKNF